MILKTLDKIKSESRFAYVTNGIRIYYGDDDFFINEDMFNKFGNSIVVEPVAPDNILNHKYHYKDKDQWVYHKRWFETFNEEFITSKEFEL